VPITHYKHQTKGPPPTPQPTKNFSNNPNNNYYCLKYITTAKYFNLHNNKIITPYSHKSTAASTLPAFYNLVRSHQEQTDTSYHIIYTQIFSFITGSSKPYNTL
jgi:hypothetical protein